MRRPSCNINVDRIRAGSIFSTPDLSDDEDSCFDIETPPRESFDSAASKDETEETQLDIETTAPEETMQRQNWNCLRRSLPMRAPVIVGIASCLIIWALRVGSIAMISESVQGLCRLPVLSVIGAQGPVNVCNTDPTPELQFMGVLQAHSQYERIYKYVDKRSNLPEKLAGLARNIDQFSMVPQLGAKDAAESPLKRLLLLFSTDCSHAVLELSSFSKQVIETGERLLMSEKAAKGSLDSVQHQQWNWYHHLTRHHTGKGISRIYGDMISASLEHIQNIIDSANTAILRLDSLEKVVLEIQDIVGTGDSASHQGAVGLDTTSETSVPSPIHGYSKEPSSLQEVLEICKEARASAEVAKERAEKIWHDLKKLQYVPRWVRRDPRNQQRTLESSVDIWSRQLATQMDSFATMLQGIKTPDQTTVSKRAGTLDLQIRKPTAPAMTQA
ncbi:hypothetical protein JX266_013219 [Neoarthrinium moseri]|nr:hypothetical protein JX266_013219 [Neoarthrinium moseri]